jgi:hypothetical protein
MSEEKSREPRGNANARHLANLARTLADLWPQALRHGFFGAVGFEAKIQDGSIQHIVTKVKRSVK